MRRLVEETACQHGYWEECVEYPGLCPGGTSRVVEPDYEAGVELISHRWSHLLKENGVWIVDPRAMSYAIVDAALGVGS